MNIQDQIIRLHSIATPIIWVQTEEIKRGMQLITDALIGFNKKTKEAGRPAHSLFEWELEAGLFQIQTDKNTYKKAPLFINQDAYNPNTPPENTHRTTNIITFLTGLHQNTPAKACVILANPGSFLETLRIDPAQRAAANARLYTMTENPMESNPACHQTLGTKQTTLIMVGPKPADGILTPSVQNNIIWLELPRPTRKEIADFILNLLSSNLKNAEEKAAESIGSQRDYALQQVEKHKTIIQNTIAEAKTGSTLPSIEEAAATMADNLTGLTLFEIENAVFSSIIAHKALNASELNIQRKNLINFTPGLTLQNTDPEFDMHRVIGLDRADEIIQKLMGKNLPERDRARSILLIGPPGCGKTMLGRAFAQRMKIPFIEVTIDKMLGGLVGDSERNLNRALSVIDSLGTCIAFFDEADKQLAGQSGETSTASNDFTQRLGGILLRWEQDRKSQAIVFKTANRTHNFSSEMLRRCDIIINVDLPAETEREAILSLYAKDRDLKIPGHKTKEIVQRTQLWSPDELKRLIIKIQAFAFDKNGKPEVYDESIEKAFEYIKPLCKIKPQDINAIRAEANAIGIPASLNHPPYD
jgi:AAA+ superfamily predicted ATPase